MPATRNPNAITSGQGRQPVDTVSSSSLAFPSKVLDATRYEGGPAWNDGVTNPATTVEAQLDKIISDLAASQGADKIGSAAYSYLPAGSVQDGLRGIVDKLKTSLSFSAGSLQIGVSSPFGYSHSEISNNPGPGVAAGGLGDLAELGATPTLEALLVTLDIQLRRRRSVTATISQFNSSIRTGDFAIDSLDSVWDTLSDQVAGQTGGVYFVQARTNATPFTVSASMPAGSYPHLIGETRYGSTAVTAVETSLAEGVPIQPSGGSRVLTGVWEGFRFIPSGANRFVLAPGYQGKYNSYYNNVAVLGGDADSSRPIRFDSCIFTRTAANTTGDITTLECSGTSASAIFEGCVFGGGSGTNLALVKLRLEAFLSIDGERAVTFKNCNFYGVGCTQCLVLASISIGQIIRFENCEFWGNPTSTSYAVEIQGDKATFVNCKFHGSPHLFKNIVAADLQDCTFYVTVDRTDSAKSVIDFSPDGTQLNRLTRNKVILAGTFGAAQTVIPVVAITMWKTEIDGLYIEYDDTVPKLSEVTLRIDYNSLDGESPAAVRNVHVNVNHKKVKGTTTSQPVVVDLASSGVVPSNLIADHVHIAGLDVGNSAADGYRGTALIVGRNITLTNSSIVGGMPLGTVEASLWYNLVYLDNRAELVNFKLLPEPSTLTPRGREGSIFMGGDNIKLKGGTFDTGPTPAGFSAVEAIVLGTTGARFCGVEGCTFYHDPIDSNTIAVAAAVGFSVKNNFFRNKTTTARVFDVVSLRNTAGSKLNQIIGNSFQHRADAGALPRLISGTMDYSLIADNTMERLSGDGGALITSLINPVGTGNIETSNIAD